MAIFPKSDALAQIYAGGGGGGGGAVLPEEYIKSLQEDC